MILRWGARTKIRPGNTPCTITPLAGELYMLRLDTFCSLLTSVGLLVGCRIGQHVRLVVLDACRENPFAEKKSLSVGRGLARIEPESGTLVAFATKHGHLATDGAGDNSPFTTSLIRRMDAPGLEINQLFRLVHDDVYASTGKKQEPCTYGQLSAQGFYFKAR